VTLRRPSVGRGALAAVSALLATLPLAPAALGAGRPGVAALQVGLSNHGLYAGPVDGIHGPRTERAVRALQRKAGIGVDGIPGPKTRSALGRYGRHRLGSRVLRIGATGWDVAELQFRLAWRGWPSGTLDGRFGPRTEGALRRFQRWAGLAPDGLLGPATVRALTTPIPACPMALAWPLSAPVSDGFGPRGHRFHTGIDMPSPHGRPVGSAAPGRVAYAGWLPGGWGYLVTVAHGLGVRTMYAHLGRVDVRVGQRVAAGATVGLVGASGTATGPHLHFEVRLRGAAVNPLAALP
jgi:peptidoglycan hydrolase-like protein with peptidoglycan-binding domain